MPVRCFDCEVTAHREIVPGIRLLTAVWPGEAPHAGQFFTVRGWKAGEPPFLSRPLSVHSWDAASRTVAFLYQVRGEGTRKIAALEPGAAVQLTGPLGNGFEAATLAKNYARIAVVGGGIGTAPLLQLTRELATAGAKPDVFLGFADVPYETEAFRPLAKKLAVATDSGRAGHHGLVTELYSAADYDLVLLCGPAPMMRAAARDCMKQGVTCLASLEARMACGIGACLGCTCKSGGAGKCVCRDGPVFDAREVDAWQT